MSTAQDEPDLPSGTMLGRYRIDRRLGAGGMGAVYLANHTGLNKTVVVKVLHAHYAKLPALRLRFVREGEAAARIRHAHVVDVTDVGVEGAIPYLVMEYLHGESLGALLDRQGALSPDRAVDLMLPVIDAVHAAHVAGVVHRDLKPDNLYLVRTPTGDPHPKVLDFGISRVVEGDGRDHRTGTAAMLGTPAYMSPEQIESARDVDAASDQYALGVVLYECLTGVQAFRGDGVYAVLSRVGTGRFDPPRVLRPEIQPALEAVVLRAMAHARDGRFPSLREFGTALLPFASPRARMIWGTTFHPPADHGASDTRLEYASAPPMAPDADTLHTAVQERDTTTVPAGLTRRRLPAAALAVGVLASAGVVFVVMRALSSHHTPAPTAAPAPIVAASPTTLVQRMPAAMPIATTPAAPAVPAAVAPASVAREPASPSGVVPRVAGVGGSSSRATHEHPRTNVRRRVTPARRLRPPRAPAPQYPSIPDLPP